MKMQEITRVEETKELSEEASSILSEPNQLSLIFQNSIQGEPKLDVIEDIEFEMKEVRSKGRSTYVKEPAPSSPLVRSHKLQTMR